jgi:hypothetical protein
MYRDNCILYRIVLSHVKHYRLFQAVTFWRALGRYLVLTLVRMLIILTEACYCYFNQSVQKNAVICHTLDHSRFFFVSSPIFLSCGSYSPWWSLSYFTIALQWSQDLVNLRFLTPIAFRSASSESSHLTADLYAHSVPSGSAVSYWDVLVLNICIIVNNHMEGSGHCVSAVTVQAAVWDVWRMWKTSARVGIVSTCLQNISVKRNWFILPAHCYSLFMLSFGAL